MTIVNKLENEEEFSQHKDIASQLTAIAQAVQEAVDTCQKERTSLEKVIKIYANQKINASLFSLDHSTANILISKEHSFVLHHILPQLLANAEQAMHDKEGKVTMSCSVADGTLSITNSITDEEKGALETFQETGATTTTKIAGGGSGLASLKKICEDRELSLTINIDKDKNEVTISIGGLNLQQKEEETNQQEITFFLNKKVIVFDDNSRIKRNNLKELTKLGTQKMEYQYNFFDYCWSLSNKEAFEYDIVLLHFASAFGNEIHIAQLLKNNPKLVILCYGGNIFNSVDQIRTKLNYKNPNSNILPRLLYMEGTPRAERIQHFWDAVTEIDPEDLEELYLPHADGYRE